MRLALEDKSAIIINHGIDKMSFPISGTNSYENTKLTKIVEDDEGNPYDPFANINDYIATLPRAQQQRLYDSYRKVGETLTDMLGLDELKDDLTECFTTIYDIVLVDELEQWLDKKNLISIPTLVENNDHAHYQSSRTYTPQKYKGLIALSVALKLAVPIWGAYVKYITKGTGVGRKEIHCAKLLKNSTLIESRQYNEFVDFIVSTHEVGKAKADSILTGVGTEEQATLLPAACLVRKIAVAPLLKSKSAVTEAFNYVVNGGPSHERKHPYIKDKIVEKGGVGEIEEAALLETYKMKESISVGDLEFIAYCCEHTEIYLREICPGIPDSYIDETDKLIKHLKDVKFKPSVMNLRLVQLFIEGIPPQIVPLLDSPSLYDLMQHVGVEDPGQYKTNAKISLIATLFTALVYMGYPAIALMCTAVESDDEVDTSIGNSRKQIPAEIDAQLDDLYPIRVSGGKDSINMVKEAISRFFNNYSGRSYQSHYTPFFKEFVSASEDLESTHYLKPDTPIQLAKITLEIYGS